MTTAATHHEQSHTTEATLFVAFELSETTWKLGFTTGHGQTPRERTVTARSQLDFIHLGNEHRQQLTWVAIGNGSFLNVGDKTRHSKIPSF